MNPGEFELAAGADGPADTRTAFLPLGGDEPRVITYEVLNGDAIVEGDILIGSANEVAEHSDLERSYAQDPGVAVGVVVSGASASWPAQTVPYTIARDFYRPERVIEAMGRWAVQTNYRFVERTSVNAGRYPDFVEFVRSAGCASMVGHQGGRQVIRVADQSSRGNVMHLIGHTLGLWHEHSRADRDKYVTLRWGHVAPGKEHELNQFIGAGNERRGYDFASIMHFPRDAFSVDGEDTIVPNDQHVEIGQRERLSDGDVEAAVELCRPPHTPGDAPGPALPPYPNPWWTRSQGWIDEAVPRLDQAAGMLQATLAWFWTAYSAVVVGSLLLGAREYPFWVSVLLALPSPMLVVAYLLASFTQLPEVRHFDERDIAQVKRVHASVVQKKRRRLTATVAVTVVSACLVAIAIVAAALTGEATG